MTVEFANKNIELFKIQVFKNSQMLVDKRPPKAALLVNSPHAGLGLNLVRANW